MLLLDSVARASVKKIQWTDKETSRDVHSAGGGWKIVIPSMSQRVWQDDHKAYRTHS